MFRLRQSYGLLRLGMLVGIIAFYLSRNLWLPPVGAFLVVADPLRPSEVVLPLAGDLERVAYAAQLYKQGYAERLLLTKLPLPTAAARSAHLRNARAVALTAGVRGTHLNVVPEIALTTFGEALNVRAQVGRMGVRSLLVVTSPWHTRRARLDLRAAFRGSGVRVGVRPSDAPHHTHNWWHIPDTRAATVSEYLKLAAYTIGVR